MDSLLQEIAVENSDAEQVYDLKGKPFRVVLANMVDLGEFSRVFDRMESRHKALKVQKNKLGVPIPKEVCEGLEDRIAGAEPGKDGGLTVYLKTEREIDTATVLECGVREPALTWAQAVVFIKLNARLAAAILKDFMELNSEVAHVDAKKDSEETSEESDA